MKKRSVANMFVIVFNYYYSLIKTKTKMNKKVINF